MGLRITKAAGWGITGLAIDDSQQNKPLIDGRINVTKEFLNAANDSLTDQAFLEYLDKDNSLPSFESVDTGNLRLLLTRFELRTFVDKQPGDSYSVANGLVYSAEYGDPGTILLVPPEMSQHWLRYDDPLDTMESFLRHEQQQGFSVKTFDHAPYPFGGWMNNETGREFVGQEATLIHYIHKLEDTLTDKNRRGCDIADTLKSCDMICQSLGFEDHGEFILKVVPAVPESVQELSGWLELFTEPNGWRHLRPMLYNFWS